MWYIRQWSTIQNWRKKNELSSHDKKEHGGSRNEHYWVNEANLKKPHTVWFQVYDILIVWLLSHVWLFCYLMDCIPLDFFVYGISQTRILESEVSQSCLTLCDPMDCSPPGSFVHGIFQARVLEWVAISFSMVFSQPRDRTQVSCIAGRHFTIWAVGCYSLLQGIFLTQRSNPCLLHWQVDFLPLSHQGSPYDILEKAKLWRQWKDQWFQRLEE